MKLSFCYMNIEKENLGVECLDPNFILFRGECQASGQLDSWTEPTLTDLCLSRKFSAESDVCILIMILNLWYISATYSHP